MKALCYLLTTAVVAPAVDAKDQELLKSLRAAQETSAANVSCGRMTARVEENVEGISATATVAWDAENTFWDYAVRYTKKATKARTSVSPTRARMIESPTELVWFNAEHEIAHTVRDRSMGYPRVLRLRPDDAWFRMERDTSWYDLLDPNSRASRAVTRFEVERKAALLTVIRHFEHGGSLRVTCSLKHGGNVVAYERRTKAGQPGWWRQGRYDWQQEPSGAWYVRSCQLQRSTSASQRPLDLDYRLSVTSLTRLASLPPETFKPAALKITDGTVMRVVGEDPQTYIVGNDAPDVVAPSRLDVLAEIMRRSGFARRSR